MNGVFGSYVQAPKVASRSSAFLASPVAPVRSVAVGLADDPNIVFDLLKFLFMY